MRLPWLRVVTRARPRLRGLAALGLLTFVGVGLKLVAPWPLKLVVDHVLSATPLPAGFAWLETLPGAGTRHGLLAWLAGATVLVYVLTQVAAMALRWVRVGIGTRMVYGLGGELFAHVGRLSLRFHGRQRKGDLVRRVLTDSACGRELLLGVAVPFLTSVVTLVSMFVVVWTLSPRLALLALSVAVPLGVVIRLLVAPLARRADEREAAEGERTAVAEQALTALPVVQVFGREAHERARYAASCAATLRAQQRAIAVQLLFNVLVGGVLALGTAAVMWLGGLGALEGGATLGDLLVVLSYVAALYAPMESLAYLASSAADASAGARRVLEVLAEQDAVLERDGAEYVEDPEGGRGYAVRLEGVTFGYEPGRPVLRGVDLEVRPGERVALVGATGAGKSTLLALVPRLFDPWEGRVTFDGRDARDLRLEQLRRRVAVLLQDPFLLPLTVAENIAYGRPEATRADIERAAALAEAAEFVERLPDGYDTVIGERGATLSGGQQQRLAIARALLLDAPVLLLDEPTSALDAETEARLLRALERLMEGRTTLVIAHRLSTVRSADRIVVLDEGRIVEQGTHAELLGLGGRYARLVEAGGIQAE